MAALPSPVLAGPHGTQHNLRYPGMHRCIGATDPREFAGPQLGILNNLSELMVREIETACERATQRQQSKKLLAAMDLYQDAFMIVDTTVRKWRILHLNLMAANEIGAHLISSPLV